MAGKSITLTALPRFPLVEPGDDVAAMIAEAIGDAGLDLVDGDILVVAQKIVSKAEGRYVDLATIAPSPRALELAQIVRKDARHVEVILSEADEVVRYRQDVLIVVHRLGFVMANAGVDESNIEHRPDEERVLLLPQDPDASCRRLKEQLDANFAATIGIVINDSFGRPWRNGVTGVALGAAGVPALRSLIGAPDLFGRAMRMTEVAVADELAAAASLLMGQAAEGLPVVHVRGFTCEAPHNDARSLIRPKERDMFR